MKNIYKRLKTISTLFLYAAVSNAQVYFSDNFESASLLPQWTVVSPSFTQTFSNSGSPQGTWHITNAGGTASHYNGLRGDFTSCTPGYVGYWAKPSASNVSSTYMVLGDASISSNNGIAFVYFASTGYIRFFNANQNYQIPYTANTWYHIELKNINFNTKTFDIYVDNVLHQTAYPFRSQSSSDVNQVHFYNFNNSTGAYDDIVISGTCPTITCPANQTVNASANCNAVVSYTSSSTGTPAPDITYSFTGATTNSGTGNGSGSTFNLGTTTVTLTATNACGTASCSFDVVVNDVTAPTITCAPDITVSCAGAITLTQPTVSDNCSVFGNALDFDGINDRVSLGNLDPISSGVAGEFTFEAWINLNSSNEMWIYGEERSLNNGIIVQVNNGYMQTHYNGSYYTSTTQISLNSWYHIAFVQDNSNLKYYINGVFVQNLLTAPNLLIETNEPNYLGAWTVDHVNFSRQFNGSMDEVRVWNIARTQAQILSSMNIEITAQTGLVALYHFNQGIAGANNFAITTASDASGNAYNGNLINFALSGATSNWVCGVFGCLTNNAPLTYSAGNTTVIWIATDASGNTASCNQTVTVLPDVDPPVITCIPDITINNAPGVCGAYSNLLIAPVVTDNCSSISSNNAIAFDGSGDFVTMPEFSIGTNDFTIEAWIKPDNNNGYYLISNRSNECCSSGNWFVLGRGTDGKIHVELSEAGGLFNYTVIDGNAVTALNTWTHVALVRSGLIYTIYINGVVDATFTDLGVRDLSTGTHVTLGGWADYNASWFSGSMNELRYWNIARTPFDIQSNFNFELNAQAGLVALYHLNQGVANGNNASITSVIDASSNNLNGVLNGFALSGTTSNWVNGIILTGSALYYIAPAVLPIGNTTVSWTATDESGNTASCSQNVTVVDNQPPVIDALVGGIDNSFNDGGVGLNSQVNAIVKQVNGKIILGGIFSSYNGINAGRIIRLNQDGSIDNSFVTGTGFNGTVIALAIQLDGSIVVGGSFTTFNGTPVGRLVRLDANGTLDVLFNAGGLGPNSTVSAIVIQTNQKIVIGGSFTQYNGASTGSMTRLNTNGTLDNLFNVSGSGAPGTVFALAMQSDNKIVIGGSFTQYNGVTANRIARLNMDGTFDNTFNPNGSGANSFVLAVAIQSDGKIIIGGQFTTFNGVQTVRLTRLNTDGTLDATFNPAGSGASSTVRAIAIQPDGKIIVGGLFGSYNGFAPSRLTRINPNGTLDITFNTGQIGANNTVIGIVLQDNGKIIAAGAFSFYNSKTANRIVCIQPMYKATSSVGVCGNVVTFDTPFVSDNCTGTTMLQTGGLPSGSSFPTGTSTISYLATDASGNTATASFDITVFDIEAPVITCPNNITVNLNVGECYYSGVLGTAIAIDNCGTPAITNDGSANYPIGTSSIIWTTTDASGNKAVCNQTVTVASMFDVPTIVCTPNVTVACPGAVALTPPVVTDNCDLTSNALNLDGIDDYAITPNLSARMPSNDITVELWFKANAEGVIVDELGQPVINTNWHNSQIEILSTGEVKVSVWALAAVSIGTVSFGTLNHAVVRYDNATQRLDGVLNGVPSAGFTIGARQSGAANALGEYFAFGATDVTNMGSGAYFNGTIDEVRIWNYARSNAEILSNMNVGINAQPGLVVSYHFNEGVANGNNTAVPGPEINYATDATGHGFTALLNNFTLNGTTSNWVDGRVPVLSNNAPLTFSAGVTTVTWIATDAAGNTASCNQTVTVQPMDLSSTEVTNVKCKGTNSGSINLQVAGATVPLIYHWSNGSTNEDQSNLFAGTYTVTITDTRGCEVIASYAITQSASVLTISASKTNVRCGGKSTGSITAMPSGGAVPYHYLWGNGSTADTRNNLIAGTYTVTVTDAAGCSKTKSVTITQNPAQTVSVTPLPANQYYADNGGGVAPYSYYWNTAPAQTTQTATILTSGSNYKVKVTDSKGCTVISSSFAVGTKLAASSSTDVGIAAMPNPTSGIVTLTVTNCINCDVLINMFDAIGQQVYSKEMKVENNTTLDFSTLATGIYTMRVMYDGRSEVVKIVIQAP